MDNLNPPSVLVVTNAVDLNQSVRLDTLFSVTDLDLDSQVTEIQFRDNSAGGGFFTQNGTILTPTSGFFHTVSADQLGTINYVGGSSIGTESITVRVFDGQFLSAPATGLITSGNSRPVVTGTDTLVQVGGQISISDLINYSDAEGDPDRLYFIVDRSIGANGGQLALLDEDSTLNPQAQFLGITGAELSQVVYNAPTVANESETISVQAFDGFSWSELADFTITTSTMPQVINNGLQELVTNERRAAADLFSLVENPVDGNEIQSYLFVDRRINEGGGFFEFNGVRQASAEFFVVSANELDQLFYVGASVGNDLESIGIIAYNGFEFGDVQEIEILTLPGPEIALTNRSVQAGHFLNFATGGSANVAGTVPEGETPILDFLDASGDAIQEFLFVDRLPEGGHFLFKGAQVPSAVWFRVPVEELDQVEYVGAQTGPSSEQIGVFVNTNFIWNDLGDFTLETIPNSAAPVLTTTDANVRPGTILPLEGLFGFTDANGDSINTVTFLDTNADASTGFFTINGVQQPAETPITVPTEQLGTVNYVTSSSVSSEDIQITVNDGFLDSNTGISTISSVGLPTIVADETDISVDTIERVLVTDLLTQTDGGPALTRYQVFDENFDQRSARFELDDVELQIGVVHDLTADEFSRLFIKGAEVDLGRQQDPILVRGTNGIQGFSEWTRINVNTDPVGPVALETGLQILGTQVITYSFIDGGNQGGDGGDNRAQIPLYYDDTTDQFAADAANTEKGFSQEQRESFRSVFESYENITNLTFVEVPYTTSTTAEIVIGSYDFTPFGGGDTNSFGPETGNGQGNSDSDIWFNTEFLDFDPDTPTDVSLGSDFRYTAIREVGLALGLGNPASSPTPLSIFNNFDYLTVQSSQHDSVFNPFDPYPDLPATVSLYDIEEVQRLYGVNTDFNSNDNQYGNFFSGSDPHFTNNDEQHQTTLYDAGGTDTLNYTLHVADESIDLRQGTTSTINGVPQSLRISYGTVIENARGGSGDDFLRGNETANFLIANQGDDILQGGGGDDVLRGGTGNDTYVWSLGDGRDFIQEFGDGGLDTIQVFDPSGSLSSLGDDLTFRRFGNDLRIDFTLNQGAGQGTVTIDDFGDEASRVEFLTIHNSSGVQIGQTIDLQSIFDQATTLAQQFTVGTELATTIPNENGAVNENAFEALAIS